MTEREYLIENIKHLREEDYDMATAQLQFEDSVELAPSKIKATEVDQVLDIIVKNFSGKEFKNKDLSPLVEGLTARQVPSRIKKLVDAGHLVDLGGSPKSYKLVQ
jgi:hypothetical protein